MCAAKVGAEEVIGIRYALISLGVKLTCPTKMIGDNQGQLDSVSNAGAFCKKKSIHKLLFTMLGSVRHQASLSATRS